MTAFNDYWLEQQRTLLGFNNNINLFSTWVLFYDADDPCYSVLMTLAGFPYYFGEESFNDPQNPNCVDFTLAFPSFLVKGQSMPGLSQDVEFYAYVFENANYRLMGVETELRKGDRNTGFFEMYGSLESLKLLFEPLVINSSTSRAAMDHQHEASSFWVYSIDQIRACMNLGEQAVLQVFDNPVYNVTNNITLTAETFTILLDNLYIEKVF